MKKLSKLTILGLAAFALACSSYLDVNKNPNQPTATSPNLVLPQALTTTGRILNSFNIYGAQIGGFMANAGGYGGFNEFITYSYTTNSYDQFTPVYDNLEDYQYIIDNTAKDATNIYFNAVATIMRVHNFQLLVDTYNDVPYSQALQGAKSLTPVYDKGATIYPALAVELDSAIARINRGTHMATAPNPLGTYDVVFGGNMTSWIQLANTIKLRLIIRASSVVTFPNKNFDPAGFLSTDALVNPGFNKNLNQQSPSWDTWAFNYQGAAQNKAWIPTTWSMTFYNGTQMLDTMRGKAIYYNFRRVKYPNTVGKRQVVYGDSICNQLGFESTIVTACPTGSFWLPSLQSANRVGISAPDTTGVLKGPDAGVPIITAAESYFLQAEAALRSIAIPGSPTAAASYTNGVTASFKYLYSLPSGSQTGNYAADANKYLTGSNSGNPLVDFSAALSPAQQLQAIITQKYIALNMVNSNEAWNEYRRTGYPLVSTSSTAATATFAAITSHSTRPDRLPTRIPYPTTEFQYNPSNVPNDINVFSSLIFWAK